MAQRGVSTTVILKLWKDPVTISKGGHNAVFVGGSKIKEGAEQPLVGDQHMGPSHVEKRT